MRSLSGKELTPVEEMNPFQIQVLGGLQFKSFYQGGVTPKRKKKIVKDKLALKRLKRQERIADSLDAHEHHRRMQNLVVD